MRNPKGQFIKGSGGFTGKHSDETKRKISEHRKGIRSSPRTEFKKGVLSSPKPFPRGHVPWNKGKPFLQIRGEKCHAWKGGVTPLNKLIRHSIEYRVWKNAVFERDNWTCRSCGKRGSQTIHAHHIKPFSIFPGLRFAIDNGITICKRCHVELHQAEKKVDLRKDFTRLMVNMMGLDNRVVVLTGDLGFNILEPIKEKYPDRFINCGIAEQNMVSVAAGMALGGLKPFVYSGSVFLLTRPYEFIRDEICYNNLPVKLIGTGAASFLGMSHNWGLEENEEDLLKNLPNIKRFYPKDEAELALALTSEGIAYIRI